MSGYGEISFGENKHYIGNHTNDRMDGFGIYININQNKAYIGFWSEGKKHGIGKYIEKDTVVKYGLFNKGIATKWFKNEKEALATIAGDDEFENLHELTVLKLKMSDILNMVNSYYY